MWTILLLGGAMFVRVPKASLFPEVDFASKCVGRTWEDNDMPTLLGPLSNADSRRLRRRLSGRKFYVRDVGKGQTAVTLTEAKRLDGIEEYA
jgi:hypothetical protein